MPSLDDVNVLLRENDIDILCVTETWLQPDLDSRFLIFPGYKVARKDRPAADDQNVRGGGICILYRSHLRVEPLEVPTAGSPLECLWVSLGGGRSAVIGAVYRPPAAPAAATDDLHEQLLHLHSSGRNAFVLGDMNGIVKEERSTQARQIDIGRDSRHQPEQQDKSDGGEGSAFHVAQVYPVGM